MLNNFKKYFNIENRTKYFVVVLFCLAIVSISIFGLLIIEGKDFNKEAMAQVSEFSNPFNQTDLEAKGVVVWDVVNHRELFSKNPNEPLPLASLTKIMTAIITREKLDNNQRIEITKEDLEPEGDSKLVVGDTWQTKDLRDFTLLTSSNDGAFALAAITETQPQFIKEMNDTASKIGLANSYFFNEHGLDREADRGGAYGSAKDMAILFEYSLKNYPEILEATRYKNLEFKSGEKNYSAKNTNTVVDQIPNLIASKTGYTDLAGGNLVIAFDTGLNRPIIISVLGSTQEGRFEDALKLVNATIQSINIGY